MRKILLFNLMLFIFNAALGQVNFEDKVNIYDYDSLSVNIIYDDFDLDGDLDLIKHSAGNSRNVLLQKNEYGDFNANPSKFIASRINPIISLDLNNDGFPDLITYQQFNTIGVLYNLQNDTFSEEETVQSFNGSYTIHPIKFDYNNDGFMDLIVIDKNEDAYVLKNNQIGGLEPAEFLISVGSFNHIYKIDDFDNDGDFDFYVYDYNSLIIYLNNDGVFTELKGLQTVSRLESFGILDLDKNGFKDVLYWKDDAIWAKYYDFDEEEEEFIVVKNELSVDNIPYNTNSTKDDSVYIINNGSDNYDIYIALETVKHECNIYKINLENGKFSNPEVILQNFEINTFTLGQYNFLDLNNNNKLDFTFTSNFNENKMIFINNDINNAVDKSICIQQLVRPNDFSVIDMNGDGIKDICVGTQNGLGFFEKKTGGELSGMRNLIGVISNPNASTYTINHITDINNDGLGDVVDFMGFGDYAKIYKNLGNDNFEFIQSISITNSFTTDISFVDIDSDGFKDLLFSSINGESGNIYNWSKNNNGNNFEDLKPLSINNEDNLSSISLAFGDFNNDNQIDILDLSYYYKNNQWYTEVSILENRNGDFFANSVSLFSGSNYGRGHIKINDFDQDGDLDFFVYNINQNPYFDTEFLFFKNDGNNNFESIVIEDLNIEDIEFYDNDGDGILEIYAWNYSTYKNNIFYYTTTDYLNFTKIEIDSYSADYNSSDPYTRGDLLLYDYNDDEKKDLFINNFSSFEGLISSYKNISTTLSVENVKNDNNLNQLKIYPNPFVNSISWNNQENRIYDIELFSISGRSILKKTTSENNLDLSFLTNGIYLFSLKNKISNQKSVYKIIKE
ncbi:T9SS type A sorting domain-containing protein [Polaribacter sp. KT 15]|uniref:T9SS type A sorting domain-containing protein n=1 Tax=Polaribacter sp. KT 15 TaxID=1896175 RepID=UPI00090A1FA7|nr:T9SS type A sorting domain-containing protein [Polaribacter sp. KT 15]SHN08239.1 Repeat domain-containing protein [Polaribacter sp. KT 15]